MEERLSGAILKDLDFIDDNRKIRVGSERAKLFKEQLRRDTEWLRKQKMMDYSLLVGIHFRDQHEKDMEKKQKEEELQRRQEMLQAQHDKHVEQAAPLAQQLMTEADALENNNSNNNNNNGNNNTTTDVNGNTITTQNGNLNVNGNGNGNGNINNPSSPLQKLKHERRQSRNEFGLENIPESPRTSQVLNEAPLAIQPAASHSEDSSIIDENDGTVMLYAPGNKVDTQRSNTDSNNETLRANTVSSHTNPAENDVETPKGDGSGTGSYTPKRDGDKGSAIYGSKISGKSGPFLPQSKSFVGAGMELNHISAIEDENSEFDRSNTNTPHTQATPHQHTPQQIQGTTFTYGNVSTSNKLSVNNGQDAAYDTDSAIMNESPHKTRTKNKQKERLSQTPHFGHFSASVNDDPGQLGLLALPQQVDGNGSNQNGVVSDEHGRIMNNFFNNSSRASVPVGHGNYATAHKNKMKDLKINANLPEMN